MNCQSCSNAHFVLLHIKIIMDLMESFLIIYLLENFIYKMQPSNH